MYRAREFRRSDEQTRLLRARPSGVTTLEYARESRYGNLACACAFSQSVPFLCNVEIFRVKPYISYIPWGKSGVGREEAACNVGLFRAHTRGVDFKSRKPDFAKIGVVLTLL